MGRVESRNKKTFVLRQQKRILKIKRNIMETDDGHQFKLETPDKRLIDVNFQRDETIGMLKERLPDLLREHGCASIPRERQRLLFNSQILQPDSATLYWIAGVGADCRIHLGLVVLNIGEWMPRG